ncbi:unnamed protein product [Acanthoscelides obtectus]|uniref:Uncharacterized protein n=1 Tax=Acanthoscelides obtectus TaxID=200917 RepID=A0A9P0PWZ8_ACAOB|nr:unnamed protein product [Acanthoscelides obtectus]CAK1678169.1 hypothetical protein AOBTE_LOCUS31771 [Acanthoscelides obtectus]
MPFGKPSVDGGCNIAVSISAAQDTEISENSSPQNSKKPDVVDLSVDSINGFEVFPLVVSEMHGVQIESFADKE